MSRYAGAILTIAGAVVGSLIAPGIGTSIGALAGSLLGGLLFPGQLPTVSGPRLSDLTQTNAQIGTPIPRGWGTFPAAGCVIAQSAVREVIVTSEVGGKAQPHQETQTPTYYQDFAIGLNGDNIYGGGEIAGVRRIWANGKIIYDIRPQQAGETDAAYTARQAASTKLAEIMTIYLGTETQLTDPTLEAFYGVGNIGAFRGLAYVVFANWLNKPEDGLRMPSAWKFEVFTNGSTASTSVTEYAQEILYDYGSPYESSNNHVYFTLNVGTLWGAPGADRSTLGINPGGLTDALADATNYVRTFVGADRTVGTRYGSVNGTQFGPSSGSYNENWTYNGGEPMSAKQWTNVEWQAWNSYTPDAFYVDNDPLVSGGCSSGKLLEFNARFHFQGQYTEVYGPDGSINTPGPPIDPSHSFAIPGFDTGSRCNPGFWFGRTTDSLIRIYRYPTAPPDPCSGKPAIPGLDGFCVADDGTITPSGAWSLDTSQNYLCLQAFVAGDSEDFPTYYPLGPILPDSDPRNTEAFWTAAYDAALAAGHRIAHGKTYDANPTTAIDRFPHFQTFGYKRTVPRLSATANGALIADIIRDNCEASGLVAGDLDLTDIAALTVVGFVRTAPMPARSVIDPLRQVGFFDAFEADGKLVFKRRGSSAVATIADDDLGAAYVGGQNPSKVITKKAQDIDLPRQIFVTYLSPERDLEQNQQGSPTRIETSARNDITVTVPVVLTDATAAQVAQVLWADAWASRWQHSLAVDMKWGALTAADCILIPVDGEEERVRITEITDSLPSVRQITALRDDDGAYVSFAIAPETPFVPPVINVPGPVEAVLMDLPLLRDADNDAGFYAAMRPYLSGTYHGAGLYRSTDGGSNYANVGNAGTAATMGHIGNALAAADPDVWDEGSTLTVTLDNGTLENKSEAAVLAGGNAAAIGDDGRWEIIQFRNAVNTAGNTWEISGLLRGRRGTEHAIGSSVTGDRFVLISGLGILRIALPLTSVGRTLQYKAVGGGTAVDAATAFDFTGRGVALKPFSVTDVDSVQDAVSGDWSITWIRRGRIGQTMASGTDIPLSEEAEDYEVDILADDASVIRTISVSSAAASYTAAQQITDFGAVQSSLDFIVYQISASVGRGYPAEEDT